MFVHRCHRPRHRFLEVVSNLLGHPDTKPTIRYLGLRTDDMVSATRVLDRVRPPLQETVEDCNRRAQKWTLSPVGAPVYRLGP